MRSISSQWLTHWGRMTHICVTYLAIIASDNDLSPSRRQAIIWISAGILLIGPLGTNCTFLFKNMHLKMSSGKWRPSCLGLNVSMMWCLLLEKCKRITISSRHNVFGRVNSICTNQKTKHIVNCMRNSRSLYKRMYNSHVASVSDPMTKHIPSSIKLEDVFTRLHQLVV